MRKQAFVVDQAQAWTRYRIRCFFVGLGLIVLAPWAIALLVCVWTFIQKGLR